jgi:hypothetical protein
MKLVRCLIIGILFLFLPVSYIHAQQYAANTYFSVQAPSGWVYRADFLINNSIILTPNEFSSFLVAGNPSTSLLNLIEQGVLVEIGLDNSFHLENATLERYVKNLGFSQDYEPNYGNATIAGERAIKVSINGTDIGKYSTRKNVTGSINSISYLMVHNDEGYYLYYIANANDYYKYLPYFEQIVKTLKFLK